MRLGIECQAAILHATCARISGSRGGTRHAWSARRSTRAGAGGWWRVLAGRDVQIRRARRARTRRARPVLASADPGSRARPRSGGGRLREASPSPSSKPAVTSPEHEVRRRLPGGPRARRGPCSPWRGPDARWIGGRVPGRACGVIQDRARGWTAIEGPPSQARGDGRRPRSARGGGRGVDPAVDRTPRSVRQKMRAT
jgi:hypothetical protein